MFWFPELRSCVRKDLESEVLDDKPADGLLHGGYNDKQLVLQGKKSWNHCDIIAIIKNNCKVLIYTKRVCLVSTHL